MDQDEIDRRIDNAVRAFGGESEPPSGIGVDCNLCKTFEATRKEDVQAGGTGEMKTVPLCEDCWDKIDRYSRGEDVSFDDELRLQERANGENENGGSD